MDGKKIPDAVEKLRFARYGWTAVRSIYIEKEGANCTARGVVEPQELAAAIKT